jgi:hypothetical protein
MDIEGVLAILRKVKYKNWELSWGLWDSAVQVQWHASVTCVKTGIPVTLNSMTISIVGAGATEESVLGAVMSLACAMELHEAQEHFLYDSRRVFDPHVGADVDTKWKRLGPFKMVA